MKTKKPLSLESIRKLIVRHHRYFELLIKANYKEYEELKKWQEMIEERIKKLELKNK